MDPALLARGFILGFTIAAAVGPISVLVIRRTLAEGRTVGLASGLGVATADATYGGIAAFGLSAITDVLVGGGRWLGLIGGIFLLFLAWRTVRSEPGPAATVTERRGGLAGRLPLDPGPDDDQPDDDPLVRGALRRARRDRRQRARVDADHARRLPGLGAAGG